MAVKAEARHPAWPTQRIRTAPASGSFSFYSTTELNAEKKSEFLLDSVFKGNYERLGFCINQISAVYEPGAISVYYLTD